jgi:outer membrane protein with beta-barrel domain
MKRITVLLALVLCVALVGNAVAKEQSLYFNLGFAGASASYEDDEMEAALELLDEVDGMSHMQVGIDLGLYFPLSPGSLLGPAITGIGDRFEMDGDHMQLNQYLYAASYRYYTSKTIGKGLFLRGDFGISKLAIDVSGLGTETSDTAFGFLVGGGYSWQISGGTWFSINADFTSKTIKFEDGEDETVGGVTVGGAFLF